MLISYKLEEKEMAGSEANRNASINMPPTVKRKRNLPGTPDPEAEVIALSVKTLLATNRFLCEICGKGFQRDQNLQLHRRAHNLPWKLKQRDTNDKPKKRVYVCPEKSCVHNNPSRALGDLTGIKKHFYRKHGEKKWKCERCSKKYAVQADWKAHLKTCGMREYGCDCGTIFSRRDVFITHRAFCDALAEETARVVSTENIGTNYNITDEFVASQMYHAPLTNIFQHAPMSSTTPSLSSLLQLGSSIPSLYSNQQYREANSYVSDFSATTLLQKAAQLGVTSTSNSFLGMLEKNCYNINQVFSSNQHEYLVGETKDFLGVGVQSLCPTSLNEWI